MSTQKKIALILRGHERNVFQTNELSNFITTLTQTYDIDIYIHTWDLSVGNSSWRNQDNYIQYPITENSIQTYFKDKAIHIKKILIDDETHIKLYGNLEGNVCSGPCPIIAWKRMWYSKFRAIEAVYNSGIEYDFVINTRFDILKFNAPEEILQQIQIAYSATNPIKIISFIHKEPLPGIDNFYIGNVKAIYLLSKNFNENLDALATKYHLTWYTEYLVYYEALLINYEIMLTVSKLTREVHNYRL
jgi:hypothetical protein